jgi:hypothetical protein
MHRFILVLPLAVLSACDVDEPLRDDDMQVQIIDERVEDERVIRTVETLVHREGIGGEEAAGHGASWARSMNQTSPAASRATRRC